MHRLPVKCRAAEEYRKKEHRAQTLEMEAVFAVNYCNESRYDFLMVSLFERTHRF